ncbi:cytochrome P450 [Mycena galopus ATCC 62051]|nr:cytochrome P450 [Mycena galopus ATCC 62051]
MASHDVLLALVVSFILIDLIGLLKGWKVAPLPPGPKPKFILGNLYDIPLNSLGLRWSYLKSGRSFIPPDRQFLWFLCEKPFRRQYSYSELFRIGWDFSLGVMPYSEKWRQHFRRDAIAAHHPVRLRKIQDFLRGLLSTPEDFFAHTKTLATAIIMGTVYGYDINPTHDRMWFPSFCSRYVLTSSRDGVGRSSVLRELLENNDAQGGCKEQESMVKDVTALAYAASTLVIFILAMALNPEVLRKAQIEIDTIVGIGSLPGFEHRSALPYCEAVVREVFRWRPILPLGVPHLTTEDNVYEGYFIPKGTMVFANIWAMVHNESIYPHPDKFNPERFFTTDGQLNADDRILAFGFGRRNCAGRHAADATVWATVVSILATFNIAKVKYETGEEIEVDPVFEGGLARSVVLSPQPM